MPPTITDYFGKASVDNNYAVATTVKSTRTPGSLVLEAYDLSKFTTDTPAYFVTYKKVVDPVTGNVSVANLTSCKALVNPDNNTFTNLEIAPGYTDVGNDMGDFIESIPTAFWGNNLIDGLLTSLNPDGTIKDEILTSFPSEFANFVGDGCVWTQLSGLNGQATSGHVWYGGKKYAISSIASKTFTASKDTYVDVNPVTDTYTYPEVANNAAEPALTASSVRVAKVITGGSAITGVILLNRKPVTSENIDFTTLLFGNYSTSEVNTGFTWIDGKEIYKKTVVTGGLPNATVKNTAHGIPSIDSVVSISGIAWGSSTNRITLPFSDPSPSTSVACYVDATNIVFVSGINRTSYTSSVVTIQYTKT